MQESIIPITIFVCVVFYQLRSAETNTLLAIIIISMLAGAAAFMYMRNTGTSSTNVPGDANDRREVVSSVYPVAKFPKDPRKQQRFLQYNDSLRKIAIDLRFIKIFDKARLGDLLIHMDHFQKIYMYILAGRYHPQSYIPILMDMRASILEILYSLIHVVPETLKHTYGFLPHEVIQRNIDAFTALSRRMLTILQSYTKANGYAVPDVANSYYHPYESSRTNILP